jgi:drug/metabolite transporter (DMT)-like permease
MQPVAARLDGTSWGLLVALAALWSVSFIFIKVAAVEIPAFTLVLVRVALAALALHVVVAAARLSYPRQPRMLARYGVMGFMNNIVPFVLIVYATNRLGAGAASILNATAPIFALLIAHFATVDERITPRKVIGILLGFAGVISMAGPQAAAGLTGDVLAVGAMLVACFFYGLSAIYGRGFSGIDATMSATCQLSASALLLLPIALIVERPWEIQAPSASAAAAVIGLALASTALAYVLYYMLIKRAGATNTILVTLLIPVGGVLLAWLFLSEAFTLDEAAGMILIGLGLVVIDGRLLGRFGLGRREALTRAP